MRLFCFDCKKRVSTEVPDDTVVRAALECPECFEQRCNKEKALHYWANRRDGEGPASRNILTTEERMTTQPITVDSLVGWYGVYYRDELFAVFKTKDAAVQFVQDCNDTYYDDLYFWSTAPIKLRLPEIS